DLEEIKMMISALGTGIGKDNINVDKIRYHKIVIMTDADVDGSHIRTLLLTFFYRQMPQVLERGYVYIAQPPLYRAKKGNSEKYLKDEAALTEHLLNSGVNHIKIVGKEYLLEADLKKTILNIQKYNQILKLSSVKYEPEVLNYFIANMVTETELFNDESKIKQHLQKLETKIHDNPQWGITEVNTKINPTESGKFSFDILTSRHAEKRSSKISADTLKAPEIIELASLYKAIFDVAPLPVNLTVGNEEKEFTNYTDFYSHVMESSKKGIYIQRYKGLGEMNPEQLWETTLNPENRMLLQVNIDDALAADETFSVLMGEQVEPRRKFIHDNALFAKSLDV
ncbi:MAG: toprim domain-containing protein, partial [Pseudobdellovibrionaceae bacterium]